MKTSKKDYPVFVVGLLLFVMTSWSLFAQVTPEGGEFQVSAAPSSRRPHVAVAPDGKFVVVWDALVNVGDILAQRFDSSGTPLGGSFTVNTNTTDAQVRPRVATAADGGFVVVWDSGYPREVFGQVYDHDGNPVGAEIEIALNPGGGEVPDTAMDADGSFVVVWEEYVVASERDVMARRFDSAGNASGAEFRVNTLTASVQHEPAVAMTPDGSFVVVWEGKFPGEPVSAIFGQRYSSSGVRRGSEFQVSSYTDRSARSPAVAITPTGEFVVTWHNTQDGSFYGSFGQRFDSSGMPVGGEFQVNSYTTQNQYKTTVAMSAQGGFLVVWEGRSDTDGRGVHGQLFDPTGAASGGEFLVNTSTYHLQEYAVTAADAAGNFVVVWQSGDGNQVFAQRLRSPCSAATPLSSGQWNMIGLPCDPGTADSVAEVVADDMAGTYGVDWIVFEWDALLDQYHALNLGSPLESGTGYWLKTLGSGETVTIDGLSTRGHLPLASSQNMIGHPFGFDVCWSHVRVAVAGFELTLSEVDPAGSCQTTPPGAACLMSRVMYKWNGAAYEAFDAQTPGAEGTLQAFDSIWVKAFEPGMELIIPARWSDGCESGEALTKARPGAEGWFVRLTVSSGELRDPGNLLGQLPDSADGYDAHDLRELPAFGDPYLTVVFPHGDWGDDAGEYTTDFRALKDPSAADEWSFEVQASAAVETATLTWQGPSWVLGRLRLVDETTGKIVAMPPDGSYTFTLADEPRRFSARVGGRQK